MCSQDGWTALHLAASAGNEELCTMLLGCGAAVNALTPQGESALHMATGAMQPGVVNQLLSAQNVDVNPVCKVCMLLCPTTAHVLIIVLCTQMHVAQVKVLLDAKAADDNSEQSSAEKLTAQVMIKYCEELLLCTT